VLLASTGGSGHVGPLLPVLSALVRRGDEVLLVVPPALAVTAGGTGQPYVLGQDPPQAELGPLWERFAVADPAEQAVLANRELFARLCTTAMLPTLEGAFARFRPELVVREPCEYASAVVAEQRGVRHVQVAIGLAEVERASLELAAPVLRSFRPDLPERLLAAPYLTRLPAALDPSPFPTTLRVRDPAPHDRPRPLPDWWAGSTDPLVYLTLGTVAGSLPEATELYRAALAAVDGLAVRVLVTLGRDVDAASLGTLPSNVHVERWVPQRDVLAQAAVVLCHGGSGTTFGALEVGVPLVVVPLFADQPANGRLIAQAGAGLVSGRSADQLRQALLRVLHDEAYQHRATALGQAMQAQPQLPDVLYHLQQLVKVSWTSAGNSLRRPATWGHRATRSRDADQTRS